MQKNDSLIDLPVKLYSYRSLLIHLVRRELYDRINGTILGVGWLLLQPLLMLSLYTLVFGVFMKARWGVSPGVTNFSLALFPGLLVFNVFSECINRAPGLILQNRNYVKKVVFPLELLLIPVMVSAIVQFLIGFALWLFMVLIFSGGICWQLVLLPCYLIPYIFTIMGLCWILSATGVYFRDLVSITPLVTQVLMFISPVLYPIENIPEKIRIIFNFNPLTLPVDAVRSVVFNGSLPSLYSLALYFGFSLIILLMGFKTFTLLRPGFSDAV